jgi:hypothetical protein
LVGCEPRRAGALPELVVGSSCRCASSVRRQMRRGTPNCSATGRVGRCGPRQSCSVLPAMLKSRARELRDSRTAGHSAQPIAHAPCANDDSAIMASTIVHADRLRIGLSAAPRVRAGRFSQSTGQSRQPPADSLNAYFDAVACRTGLTCVISRRSGRAVQFTWVAAKQTSWSQLPRS